MSKPSQIWENVGRLGGIDNVEYGSYRMLDFEQQCSIICKRLKLKSENLNPPYVYGEIKAPFFLPWFLPIYAVIPEPFIEMFESDYKETMNSSFKIVNNKITVKKSFLKKDLIAALKTWNNFDFIVKSGLKMIELFNDQK